MKLSDLLDNLLEMGMGGMGGGGGAATTSAGVAGVPMPVGVVTREYPGYDADRRKKKKGKKKWTHPANWYKAWTHYNSPMHKGTPMSEDDAKGEAINSSDKKYSDDGNSTKLGRLAFKGDRPRYRPKKTFITRKPSKPKAIKEQDEWEPLQQRTPAMDLEWLRKGFEGDRPGYKPKKQKLTKKKGDSKKKPIPVEEQFMGPQLFYDSSPYHDLEFLVKFWRGSKKGDLARPEGTPKKPKKLKEKPIGTYGTSMPTSK
jgi:hypothetical protein